MGQRRQLGVTLVEVILVLAIGASMVLLSLRFYRSQQLDNQMQQVRYMVDGLFQAAAAYYYANCSNCNNQTGVCVPIINGPLSAANAVSNTVKVLDVTNDLINNGYLSSSFNLNSPQVAGFVVQFNPSTAPVTVTSGTQQVQIGTSINWEIQISVLMQNTSNMTLNQNYLQGDCQSAAVPAQGSAAASGAVAPCSAGTPGNYIVFTRSPSYATSHADAQSTYWVSMPALQQFNQTYSSLPLSYLMSVSHNPEVQYYYCGS